MHARRLELISIRANMPYRAAISVLILSLLCGCGRPPADKSLDASGSQNLPFDRQPRSTGISPSQSLIPSTTKLPEGTPIPVRLESSVSSASAHAGDSFSAVVDEPIVVDGQTRVAGGTRATGRVLEARASGQAENSLEPGYVRIVLVSFNVKGKAIAIETSSIFAKGGSRDERKPAAGAASGTGQNSEPRSRDIVLGVDRHLNFRLAQTVDLE